jgi:oligoribonuclease NrnB/cAMP/cGMP phosphodiesterase (DHH superfamily)
MAVKVLYHANCTDGAGSALAAYIAMGDRAEYIPVQYGYKPPEITAADAVYMVDFSYPQETLFEMARTGAQIMILDHHKTAKDDLESIDHPNIEVQFDMSRSGAVMTWEYFHPDRPVPALLAHIQDRDLWQFKLPGSKEVHRGLGMYPDWHDWAQFLFNPERLIQDGAAIIKFLDRQIDVIISHEPREWEITGDVVPVYNLPGFLISDALHAALDKYPECPYAVGYIDLHDRVVYSLRARNGGFDTTTISRLHGGGGHAPASGFKVMK